LDIAPTILRLLGVPVPSDMDGRVLTEVLDPAIGAAQEIMGPLVGVAEPVPSAYTDEEDAAIQQRLADLGYL
jgi:hypothetical protein